MARGSGFSAQTLLVLAALSSAPADWRHGYDLARETGLKSGTLYPILVRLADRELLEARWEESPPQCRPARHLYRLTQDGLELAAAEARRERPVPAPAGNAAARTAGGGRRQAPQPGGAS